MIIYRIFCQASGKSYVGVTQVKLRRRWNGHVNGAMKDASGLLASAIRRYGKKSFDLIVLAEGFSSRQALHEAERSWIIKLGTMTPAGYNIRSAGSGPEYGVAFRKSQKKAARLRSKNTFWKINNRLAMQRLSKNREWRKKITASRRKQAKDPAWLKKNLIARMKMIKSRAFLEARRKQAKNPLWLRRVCAATKRTVKTASWKRNHLNAVRRLANDENWLKKNMDVGRRNSQSKTWRKKISVGLRRFYAARRTL